MYWLTVVLVLLRFSVLVRTGIIGKFADIAKNATIYNGILGGLLAKSSPGFELDFRIYIILNAVRSGHLRDRSQEMVFNRKAIFSGEKMTVFKMTEIVGLSKESFADAASNAVKRASKTLRNMKWFETTAMRGKIKDGEVVEYQVTLKVGFKLED
ncbi:MAG: dodecin family protein [Candidatus Obscuribacterales bacterium]|nr:dodecin family protein [Candidatus Obscuribacterales bacterium]